jgi:AcrR family transcriptional regulator
MGGEKRASSSPSAAARTGNVAAAKVASPRGSATREDWLAVGMRLLASGRSPADVPLSELAAATGVSKGSFYAHFPGGLDELHTELLARWVAQLQLSQVTDDMRAVRDPADRIRLLLERALAAPGVPGAMQRWAAASDGVAAAVGMAQDEIGKHAAKALADMGLAATDAALLSRLLVRAFLGSRRGDAGMRAELDALIEFVQRGAATPPAAWRLQAVPLDAPDAADASSGIILYPAPADLSADERRKLGAAVQDFVSQRRPTSAEASNGVR